MVERDMGGERVDVLVLSHERVGRGTEVGFGHFRSFAETKRQRKRPAKMRRKKRVMDLGSGFEGPKD